MHEMRSDLRNGMIEVEYIGFWQAEDIEAYKRDFAVHAARIDATGKRRLLLIDHSRAAIQSQAMVAALSNLVLTAEDPCARIAVFTTGQFARLQAKRIAALRDSIRVFEDRDGAVAWLTEPDAAPRPAASPRSACAL